MTNSTTPAHKDRGGLFFGSQCCILKTMKYLATLNKSEYGYSVSVPALPGCHSQGKTKKEALENIQDAILTYLAISEEELEGTEVSEVEVAIPS